MSHHDPSEPQRSSQRRTGPRPASRRLLAGLVGVAVLLGACAGGGEAGPTTPMSPSASTPAEAPATTAPAPVPGDPAAAAESATAGAYLSLVDYERDAASFAGDDVVLFFAASWCSTCRRARANIEADLAGIPQGLVIVVVDYDAERDLRRRYGVTVQHTFVQIDTAGEPLKKWSGSLTAQEIAEQTV